MLLKHITLIQIISFKTELTIPKVRTETTKQNSVGNKKKWPSFSSVLAVM